MIYINMSLHSFKTNVKRNMCAMSVVYQIDASYRPNWSAEADNNKTFKNEKQTLYL